jgi:anti-sigma factor RsiW
MQAGAARVRRIGHFDQVLGLQITRGIHALEEVAHVVVRRVFDDFLRRTHLYQPSAFHDGDAGADAQRLFQIVRHKENGAALLALQLKQDVLHFRA